MNVFTPVARETVRRSPPGLLKVLSTAVDVEALERWRAARPDGILVYRHYFVDNNLDRIDRRVRAVLRGMEGIRHLVDVVETPWNEAWQANGQELGAYATATVEAVNRLHDAGCDRVSVGHFSMGNPARLEDWEAFYPALAAGDLLDLHEYSRPTMQTDREWHCLRFRRVYGLLPPELRLPLYIGECGLDWTGAAQPVDGWGQFAYGWRAHGVSAQVYSDQLRWYMSELSQDSYVLGATVYNCGSFDDFKSFDIAGEQAIEAAVREYSVITTIEERFMFKDQFPAQYAEWEAAGGVDAAFGAHLRGIGALPPDLPAAIANLKSAVAQLENQLPK